MPRVAVVADDLIWASRLADAVRRAGAEPIRTTGLVALRTPESMTADAAVVDVALRSAEPLAVIAALRGAGLAILAVADHDDVALRKRALAAGASKVLAYRKLHEAGPATIGAWLAELAQAPLDESAVPVGEPQASVGEPR